MAKVAQFIGKLSRMSPEDVQKETGYTIFSHNRSRKPKSDLPKKEAGLKKVEPLGNDSLKK